MEGVAVKFGFLGKCYRKRNLENYFLNCWPGIENYPPQPPSLHLQLNKRGDLNL
jgi:hypothetical protein